MLFRSSSVLLITIGLQYGECPEESLKIAGKRDVLRVSSWSELIQVPAFSFLSVVLELLNFHTSLLIFS